MTAPVRPSALEREAAPPVPGTSYWHSSAPHCLRRENAGPDAPETWARWRKHLRRRRRPVSIERLWSDEPGVLLWGLGERPELAELSAWARQLDALHGQRDTLGSELLAEAALWLDQRAVDPPDARLALEALIWCHRLPRLARRLPGGTWWRMVDALIELARSGADRCLIADPLAGHWLDAELPLSLAYQFPEFLPCRTLAIPAEAALARAAAELPVADGGWPLSDAALAWPLVASWARCRRLAKRALTPEARERLEAAFLELFRPALRLVRPDGTRHFQNSGGPVLDRALLAAATRRLRHAPTRRAAQSACSGGRPAVRRRDFSPALHAGSPRQALLRSDWSRSAPRLVVDYGQRTLQLELCLGGELAWSGPAPASALFDGQALNPQSDWRPVHWISNGQADYLELEQSCGPGISLRRQFLLARRDAVLLVADVWTAPAPGAWEATSTWPACPTIEMEPSAETRDAQCAGRRPLARILPLPLPEWRSDRRWGGFSPEPEGWALRVVGQGGALWTGIWLALDRRRQDRCVTWRRLTVAQDRAIVAPDVAVGFRVQVGRRQWLVYRSLAPRTGRTVLGQHLAHELLVARFRRSGRIEPLVQVDE